MENICLYLMKLLKRILISTKIVYCLKSKQILNKLVEENILSYSVTDNPSIMIYVNKTENRITFKIKAGYYIELLTPEIMKLLGNTKSKITKDENGENVPHLKTTEVVLIHFNIDNNGCQQDSRVWYTVVSNKTFG